MEIYCRDLIEQLGESHETDISQCFSVDKKSKSIEELYNSLKNIRDLTLEKFYRSTRVIEKHQDMIQKYKEELKNIINNTEQDVITATEEAHQAYTRFILSIIIK